jgi:integrase
VLMGTTAKITFLELQALTPEDAGRRIRMGDNMTGDVRADKTGVISVRAVWRCRIGSKSTEIPLGTWKATGGSSLAAIRKERDKFAAQVADGKDPAANIKAAKLKAKADQQEAIHAQTSRLQNLAALDARQTVRDLATSWIKLELRNRADSGADALRAFEKDVFPAIGNMAAADVTRAHVQQIIDDMMARGVTRMTKRVLSDLRQMFGFALDRELIEADPTSRIKKAKIGPDGERDRFLSESEITALMAQLPKSGLKHASQHALRLQLATLARIGEVLAAEWKNVDFERRVWTLPTTKNGKAHAIYLSDFALAEFQILKTISRPEISPWVFPARNRTKLASGMPLCSKTITKTVADRQRDGEPMSGRSEQTDALRLAGGQWRPHDLRRTGATHLAELGAMPDVIERCLNHTEENRMKRIYQRAQFEEPMRNAWRMWGDRLALLDGKAENVITITPRRLA